MIVSHYSRRLLERFITVGMALVGRSLYLRHVLGEQCAVTSEDLSTANRLFMSLAARFIQYGVPLLAESVRNVVQPVFGKVSLQEPMTPTLMDALVGQVRHEIESACGKSVLDDSIFGRLEELVGADLPPSRRRLFIAMMTECRGRMRDPTSWLPMLELVKADIDAALFQAAADADDPSVRPMLAVISTLGRNFYQIFGQAASARDTALSRRLAAVIFADPDSDVQHILVPHHAHE